MQTWASSQQLVIVFFRAVTKSFHEELYWETDFDGLQLKLDSSRVEQQLFYDFGLRRSRFFISVRTLTNSQFFGTVDALIPSYRDDRTRPWVLLVSNWAPSSKTFELVTMPALTAPPTPPRSLRGRVVSANINPLGDLRSGGHHNNRSTSADEEEQR